MGSIVQAGVGATVADHTIAEIARGNGVYRTDEHLRRLTMGELAKPEGAEPADIVASHVRRLEALRRARIVSRYEEGRWSIPKDFLDQASAYEARRGLVRVLSPLDLDRQVRSPGATWLDRQLVTASPLELADHGFGAEVKAALQKRTQVLQRQELAFRVGEEVIFTSGLVQTLAQREVARAAEKVERQTGLQHWPAAPGQWVEGTYAGKLELDSGAYAIIRQEGGFWLAPWRPVIEPKLGQEVRGLIEQGLGVSWELSRGPDKEHDLSLGMKFDDGLTRSRGRGLGL